MSTESSDRNRTLLQRTHGGTDELMRPGKQSPMCGDTVVARLRAAGCVFAEDEARLLVAAARDHDHLAELVSRRVGGMPLEYVLGWASFGGLRVTVDVGVFVPRVRTGFLANLAVAATRSGTVVVELCCGSGAVAMVVADRVRPVELFAVDVDPVAVRCAARNLGGVGTVLEGDLFEALPRRLRGRIDVLVANAPYVPTDEIRLMPAEARDHERLVALDGGADGVDVHRRVAAGAPDWLAPGGQVLVETSAVQAPLTVAAFASVGMTARVRRSAEVDATVVVSSFPSPSSADPA